jgi:hypothetical protein
MRYQGHVWQAFRQSLGFTGDKALPAVRKKCYIRICAPYIGNEAAAEVVL